jgi:uncharacterized membrane protein
MSVLAGLLFGIVAGLRTFTGEAVYFGLRGGVAGTAFPVLAVAEYVADSLPSVPPRTEILPAAARMVSAAFMGWIAARIPGAILAVAGALIGTFGGYRARMAAIVKLGALPAAIVEDVVAIALAFAGVALLAK